MLGQIVVPRGLGDSLTGKIFLIFPELEEIESVKRIGGRIGWGATGFSSGPGGLNRRVAARRQKTAVTFVAKFKDERKMLGSTNSKTFNTMMATVFK